MGINLIKEEDARRMKTIFKVEIDSMDLTDWEKAKEMLYGQLIDENNKYRKFVKIFKDKLKFVYLGETQSGLAYRGDLRDWFSEDEVKFVKELINNE